MANLPESPKLVKPYAELFSRQRLDNLIAVWHAPFVIAELTNNQRQNMSIENFEHAGLAVKIFQDCDAESPREWDNLGTIVHWHRRYDFGEQIDNPQEFLDALPRGSIVLPIALLDHSGLHMWVGNGSHWSDAGGWDSGQVGFIYCTPEQIRKEYSCKRISKQTREKAERVLRGEIEAFDQFLRGDVYGYQVTDEENNHLDSCCGFFGFEYCKAEAKSAAEHCAKNRDASACLI